MKQEPVYEKSINAYRLIDESVDMYHPADTLANKVRELFKQDPLLKLMWNENKKIVYFYSTNLAKAEAIRYILPEVYNLSETTKLYIEVYYKPNTKTKILLGRPSGYHYDTRMLCKAFDGNPLWYYMHEWKHNMISNAHCWLGFSLVPVFYVDDNLENLYSDSCYLPADLAKAVLDTNGVHICTYNPDRKLIKKNTVANSLYEDTIDWDEEINGISDIILKDIDDAMNNFKKGKVGKEIKFKD